MQDQVLTLAVDELNNATPTDHVFDRYDYFQNRSIYQGENHSSVARDTLTLYRTPEKPSGNFKGVRKSAFKFSTDKAVTGADGLATLTSPIIAEVSFSVPVGVTAADMMIARQRCIALLDDDDVMDDLMDKLMI